jgi:hypothetical protein
MLVACRLAGLSALETYYAGSERARNARRTPERPRAGLRLRCRRPKSGRAVRDTQDGPEAAPPSRGDRHRGGGRARRDRRVAGIDNPSATSQVGQARRGGAGLGWHGRARRGAAERGGARLCKARQGKARIEAASEGGRFFCAPSWPSYSLIAYLKH